ncbi:MAG: hypothetical protein HQL64_13095 [Magnetococcales bacterium]|nr:hypothetical protein [Magnetococcales bacterium]
MYTLTNWGQGLLMLLLVPAAMAAEPAAIRIQETGKSSGCANCHAWRTPDPQPRVLTKPHATLTVNHGQTTIWCPECHLPSQPEQLQIGFGPPVAMVDAWRLCERCHAGQTRDWRFGVHGKRVQGWRGERRVSPCANCHDAHHPAWSPVSPAPPPNRPRSLAP